MVDFKHSTLSFSSTKGLVPVQFKTKPSFCQLNKIKIINKSKRKNSSK